MIRAGVWGGEQPPVPFGTTVGPVGGLAPRQFGLLEALSMARISSPVPVWALVATAWCVVALSGCTMCPDPFDYSGPVPNGSAPQNDFRARSNGIAPIDAAPRPWPPLVQREAEPETPVIAEDDAEAGIRR